MPKGEHNRKLSDDDRAEIVRLYTTPLPDGTWTGAIELGRRFGVRHPVIYRELQRAGVTTRTMSEAHQGKACKPITNLPVGEPPLCKCGCGSPVPWHQRKKRWCAYAEGHYTQRAGQNHRWNNGSSLLPYPYNWKEIAQDIRARDNYTCQKCGSVFHPKSGRLHVHHRDRDRSNNSDENLVTLCRSCHARAH